MFWLDAKEIFVVSLWLWRHRRSLLKSLESTAGFERAKWSTVGWVGKLQSLFLCKPSPATLVHGNVEYTTNRWGATSHAGSSCCSVIQRLQIKKLNASFHDPNLFSCIHCSFFDLLFPPLNDLRWRYKPVRIRVRCPQSITRWTRNKSFNFICCINSGEIYFC